MLPKCIFFKDWYKKKNFVKAKKNVDTCAQRAHNCILLS